MSKKGERRTQKRLSASTARAIKRKETAFTSKTRPGAHSRETSIPLVIMLRDIIKVAGNQKEAKVILNKGYVLVDGVQRKDPNFNVGLFDAVDITLTKKRYRMLLDRKGRLYAKEIPVKEKLSKLCRVTGKRALGKALYQYTLNDGSSFRDKDAKISLGWTVKMSLPARKVEGVIELKEGSLVYLVKGTHVGTVAKVREVMKGTMAKPSLISLEMNSEAFHTLTGNVFVVGMGKLEVELGD